MYILIEENAIHFQIKKIKMMHIYSLNNHILKHLLFIKVFYIIKEIFFILIGELINST